MQNKMYQTYSKMRKIKNYLIVSLLTIAFQSTFSVNAKTTVCNDDRQTLAYSIYEEEQEIRNEGSGNDRDISSFEIIPRTWIENGKVYFEGIVSISDMKVHVTNHENNIYVNTIIQVPKNDVISIDLATIPYGTYNIIITIGEDAYIAEFSL